MGRRVGNARFLGNRFQCRAFCSLSAFLLETSGLGSLRI
jgi:hypothetical protein